MLSNSVQLKPRLHSISILEFGTVGDGKTLNTLLSRMPFSISSLFLTRGCTALCAAWKMAYRKFQPYKPSHAVFGEGCCHSWISVSLRISNVVNSPTRVWG